MQMELFQWTTHSYLREREREILGCYSYIQEEYTVVPLKNVQKIWWSISLIFNIFEIIVFDS